MTAFPPLIVLIGATAVGKTGIALELADALNGEIVGADSRQVYRYMDIGTAKPTPEQRQRIRHHVIDLIEPDDTLSLSGYLDTATAAIDDIHQRGKLPFLVGGTGQYVTALIEGWSVPSVAPNLAFRAELEAFAAKHGAAALGERLKSHDPAAYDLIDYRNVRRVIRALEVINATGQKFSDQRIKHPPPYRILHYGLTMEREALYERADRRVDTMIREGFVDEVKSLIERGYVSTLPSMSALGYKELTQHLMERTSLDEAVKAIYSATHDFIRRQYTWFRKHNADAEWLDAESLDVETLTESLRQKLRA